MTAGFPALGFDPAPGDVGGVQYEARRFAGVAHEVAMTVRNLEQVDAGYWKGEAATAFVGHVRGDLTPLLAKLSGAFTEAASSMTRWAGLLDGFQQQARALEARAEEAQAGVAAAKSKLASATAQAGTTLTAAERTARQQLQDGVTSAGNDLAAIQREAQDLQGQVDAAARRIAGELQHAGNMAPSPPGWLDSLFHDVTSGLDDTWDWVKAHAAAIKFFSDLMRDVSSVLQILAIITAPFEPVGAIFEAAALVTGAVALLSALLAKAAGANESWMDIGMDALSVLPGVASVAKSLSTGVKVAEVGADAVDDLGVAERIAKIGDGVAETTSPKEITLFGKEFKLGSEGWKITGIEDKTSVVFEKLYQNLRSGQLVGTKGLRLVGSAGSKLFEDPPEALEFLKTIDQTSWAGRGFDAGIKLVPKLYTIPHGIEKDLKSLGDSFGTAVSG